MNFRIAVCDSEASVRAVVQTLCFEYFARRTDHCVVEGFASPAALLRADEDGTRYELYLIGLAAGEHPAGLAAAAELRARGRRVPLAFLAAECRHAYEAFRVDAMQYLLRPVERGALFALLERAAEPEYGPSLSVCTAGGLYGLTFASVEYVECTHHVLHFHCTDGRVLRSVSQRVPFAQAVAPLLADARFLQPHRSYVVNLAAAEELTAGEFRMHSGARVPVPREKEPEMRTAFAAYLNARSAPPAQT